MKDEELKFKKIDKSQWDKVAHWIAGDKWPFHTNQNPSIEHIYKSINEGNYSGEANKGFWILLDSQPEPVGIIHLQELTGRTPVFDLRIKSSFRNLGIGRKSLDWLAEYVFTKTNKHRLEGHTRADNMPMRRVFKTCGLVLEAYYRQDLPDSSGNYCDAVSYAIIKKDWDTGTKTKIDWNNEL